MTAPADTRRELPRTRRKTRWLEDSATVLVAMGANLSIAVAKLLVAATAGSSAMFAEGVHSVVDTLNQVLLLLGVRRSRRRPDRSHPFGYGKELYVWSLIYSVLLFGIGGGASIVKGVSGLVHPTPTSNFGWSYLVLGVALVAEGSSWLFAVRSLQTESTGPGLWRKLRRATDPSRFVIVAEDGAAIAGIVIAFAGILATQLTGSPNPDNIASILIGLTLCAVAVLLISKTMGLLVGRAVPPEVVREIERMVAQTEGVSRAGTPLTMHLGPGQALAVIDVRFHGALSSLEVAQAVDRLQGAIRARFPEFTRIYIEAQVADRDVESLRPR